MQRIPVKIVRREITPDADGTAVLNITKAEFGHVLDVMAENVGTNSVVKIGDGSVFRNIPASAGTISVAYGCAYPHYFEDKLVIAFRPTGANPVHLALIEIIVEKEC